jgi:DNA-binding CsgD family transcriptional regulator
MQKRNVRWELSVAVVGPNLAIRSCIEKWLEESSVEVPRPSDSFEELEHVAVGLVAGATSEQAASIAAAAMERKRPPIIVIINDGLAEAVQRIREAGGGHQRATDQLALLGWARLFNRLVCGLLFDSPSHMEENSTVQSPGLAALTPRERQVLRFVVAGADNLKIAAHLEIRERTVKAHVSNMFRKFNCENRVQLAMRGSQLGVQPALEA